MRFLPLLTILVSAGCFAACDAHDYWFLPNEIVVNSDQGILTDSNEESIEQDLFVRYQVDYSVSNQSQEKSTEVVVSGTTYVNSIERTKGQKVWHLEPGETGEGILTSSQLELGNMLVVSLECCSESKCSRKEAICPQNTDNLPDSASIADFCYNACDEVDSIICAIQCPLEDKCIKACQADKDCQKYLNVKDGDPVAYTNYQAWRELHCNYGGDVSTCFSVCKDDLSCYDTQCIPTDECLETCVSNRATCFRNCLATWTQCTEDAYDPGDGPIPCELCGKEGLCHTNFSTNEAGAYCREDRQKANDGPDDDPYNVIAETYCLKTVDSDEIVDCSLDCSRYPAACVMGCEKYYESAEDRVPCLDRCLQQHLFWCNDFTTPKDYVDSNGKQPCCFESYCNNALETVIKTYDVECFNDSSCSTNHYCSSEGKCVSTGASSNCSGSPGSSTSFPIILFILAGAIALGRRKHA